MMRGMFWTSEVCGMPKVTG
ncbi:hypothetical protein ACHAWX_003344 [Stephanocyclus meneghinianus]